MESKLSFLTAVNLEEVRAVGKRQALIEAFALERSINLLWAPAGTGKTTFVFSLAKHFIGLRQEVAIVDTDNGLDLLQDRGYDNLIESLEGKLRYINADSFDDPKKSIMETLESIRGNAKDNAYRNCVFIFDSLKFFLNGGIYDEEKINKFIAFCKAIRRAGGLVFVLNHATKKGDTMKGGQSLIDAFDECWQMTALPETDTHYNYILEPEKERMAVKKVGFSVDKKSYELTPLDVVVASLSTAEKEFIDSAMKLLKDQPLKQGDLLQGLGKDKADKTSLEMLKKHEGRFWSVEKVGKEKMFTTVTTVQLCEKSA